jgi:hypothetical protein
MMCRFAVQALLKLFKSTSSFSVEHLTSIHLAATGIIEMALQAVSGEMQFAFEDWKLNSSKNCGFNGHQLTQYLKRDTSNAWLTTRA